MDETKKQQLKDYLCDIVDSGKDSLITLRGGSAIEMFDRALQMVLENIADVNTTADKREIHIKVVAVPNTDHRYLVGYAITVPPPKLCGQEPVATISDIRVDPNGRGLYSVEKVDPQIPIFGKSNVKRIGGSDQ